MAKEYHVGVVVDDKTKKGTKNIGKNLDKTASKADKLANRFRNMARTTAAIEGPLGGVAGRLSSIGALLGSVNLKFVAFGAAFAGATILVKSSISAFADYEQQMFGINALIVRTGASAGVTGQEISDMADRIGRDTLASAEGIRSAAAVMLTFKSVSGDAFERSIKLAQDMSAVMKVDLNSTVKQLGKVLEAPIRNLSALNRSGVSFTATQSAMIKSMVEMGDKAGAQTVIMDVLAGQLGGFGAAEGGGLAGSIDLVSENWVRLMREIGNGGTADVALKVIEGWGIALGWFADKIADSTDTTRVEKLYKKWILLDKRLTIAIGNRNSTLIRHFTIARAGVGSEIHALETKIKDEKELDQINKDQAAMLSELNADNEAASAKEIKLEDDKKEAIKRTYKARLKAAEKFGETLQKEADMARQSSMEKMAVEDERFANNIDQIEENHIARLISGEDFFSQSELAEQAHEDRKTAIKLAADKKREELEASVNAMVLSAKGGFTNSMLNLGNTLAKDNEKLQKTMFLISRGVAVANIIVATNVAALKAASSEAIIGSTAALAAAARIKTYGYATAAITAATAISGAREHGGPVIAGRSYKVGERGVETFTPNSSGMITNNANTVNNGGATYITNNYIDAIDTKSFNDRITESGEAVGNANAGFMYENGLNYG